ncbi:YheT family hydrolase [Comamonas thiooxydans]|uniref:Alpha/beta hydrolase n=1 Tax=Comamonas thiooxydans TaxID=363952 RepID=A0A0K6IF85_9BURK|nr:alpha/beta fold hydrolase [Comamonas thiooxydans]KGH07544.1 alpha/beta hydrolase [Comamonas thiooxydans]KGH16257.1 alpha/beta hydrolase [Comamonas thiooxydans]KGH20700.1 alpha/beta hydrolase [Comamonas thiooxydans]MCO8248710.1 alpha/beta fold hydrolase [Comamonas thiooxydans]OAD81675.1 alpha/beta hydrolase [Comamonas thiooxydans]
MNFEQFRAPWWQPGGHVQTIWAALCAKGGESPAWRRERWDTPDGDFIDIDFSSGLTSASAPTLVLFHGLEGSSSSHYAKALAQVCAQRGWHLAVPHFRGCSGEPNRLLRAYHSGDSDEVDWVLRRLQQSASGELLAMGVSLGGNALARWAGLQQQAAAELVKGAAVICAPLDLVAGGVNLGQGLNRWIYTPMFMRTLVPKALAKWQQSPGVFDRERLQRARTLHDFDDVFTAPVHGFRDADDYWSRASAKPLLKQVAVPLLLLNARNDPFVPAHSLPRPDEVSATVQLWQPPHGGHVGFASGAWPAHVQAMPLAVTEWLEQWL